MSQADQITRKEIEMLRILSEYKKPIGSTLLKRELRKKGFLLSDRTIRYHLQLLQMRGFVEGHDRSGRTITLKGLEELSEAFAYQRLGFILTRFLSLAYSTTYDPEIDSGSVVTNVSIIDKNLKEKTIEIVKSLRKMNLLPAPYIRILEEGESSRDISVPKGKIALLTVCNLTTDGILIHAGIPLLFNCGGLVQFLKHKPIRFVEMITYEGTTIPPLEVFVYRKMTSINKIISTGSGMLPANLREIPAEARDRAVRLLLNLKRKGWGGVLAVGKPNEHVLGVPVGIDRFGVCMVGGLISGAAIMEEGASVDTFAPHCLVPIEEMERI